MTQPTIADIQRAVTAHYGLSATDMASARRSRRETRPRQVAMYLCRHLTKHSSPAIGLKFARDHTTVLHGIRQIERLVEQDPDLAADVAAIREKVGAPIGPTPIGRNADSAPITVLWARPTDVVYYD